MRMQIFLFLFAEFRGSTEDCLKQKFPKDVLFYETKSTKAFCMACSDKSDDGFKQCFSDEVERKNKGFNVEFKAKVVEQLFALDRKNQEDIRGANKKAQEIIDRCQIRTNDITSAANSSQKLTDLEPWIEQTNQCLLNNIKRVNGVPDPEAVEKLKPYLQEVGAIAFTNSSLKYNWIDPSKIPKKVAQDKGNSGSNERNGNKIRAAAVAQLFPNPGNEICKYSDLPSCAQTLPPDFDIYASLFADSFTQFAVKLAIDNALGRLAGLEDEIAQVNCDTPEQSATRLQAQVQSAGFAGDRLDIKKNCGGVFPEIDSFLNQRSRALVDAVCAK